MNSQPWKIYSRGRKHVGKPTGSTRFCTLENCGGTRITTRWDNGKVTHPCSEGMNWSPKGNVAEIV